MKDRIVALNRSNLDRIITEHIAQNGFNADLNHIDVSRITNMKNLFRCSRFNGDISKWDVSSVEDMEDMFSFSNFNKDISNWNVSNVVNMSKMFFKANFIGDISNWKPYSLTYNDNMFDECNAQKPYWSEYKNKTERKKAIEAYWLKMELNKELCQNNLSIKRIKL